MKHTISEAADLARVSRSTIDRYMKKGKLSYDIREDGTRLVDTSELERVFKTLKKTETSQGNGHAVSQRRYDMPVETGEMALLCQENMHLKEQVEQLRQDRDELKDDLKEEREGRKGLEKKLIEIVEQQNQLMLEDKRKPAPEPEKVKNRPVWLHNPLIVYPVAVGSALLFALLIIRFAADFLLSALLP